ncbi:MAG: GtrA family protein [Candidatus Aquirickettsiella gammari]|jgi:putative flippase GtrA|uniref:GtrA family protein n=1 Tax=Candidatus Aquirickettsiella gammari TaxID=2016198 RepID=A0A370CJD9_9COXI|nr:MAG: GtrA family protein [Candidatus Aquirickettsiella gammari]
MNETISTKKQFIRFLLVGCINTFFGYSIYVLLIFMGARYFLASFLATCLGMVFNFVTTGRIVFANNSFSIFFKFILVYMFLYGLNVGFIKVISLYTINFYLSGFVATVPISCIAFFLNRSIFLNKYTDESILFSKLNSGKKYYSKSYRN